ncbi:hypothetical protein NDA11_006486 [Ustilago hordei]|uniref:MOSC domain-containing protein n=1 Tax=Ustilago hordei TaxID=120017 RepID=I2G4J9_USTHO|nr:uncharacterized protein UHO2_01234 [Ustilago hordei]KAJ1044517.1 hypothetical protein NDA10_003111 [Ustilago hordei]KAJ1583259.1 hypothetical protein NDA15_001956 [Ustilago hordei]KAJ1586830.1 hypothetical protein NDA11_006486 [Ustilago hordei]KAJ1592032.1 hypothetical protein NDA12_004977 [Ustilago hordei]KAJ1603344.1 hypothetical protein NDA14_005793 [Ustilago hordei]
MPAKIPFFQPSDPLKQKWLEATNPTRISAQLYVFALLIAIGLLRHYLSPTSSKTSTISDHTFGSTTAPTQPGAKDESLGEIDSIFIYPIKSCAGVSVSSAVLTGQGFELDRRWMVIGEKDGKWDKMSLREEARLTLIQPEIDEQQNVLRLRLSDVGQKEERRKEVLEGSETTLRPTAAELKGWKEVPAVEMYGDYADGRVASLPAPSKAELDASNWISSFLGYKVLLIHFDTTSNTKRKAFPIFKPPSDPTSWSSNDKTELHRERGIEFQDEYPLLVASVESLSAVRSQLSSALDGKGARPITQLDPKKWSAPDALNMARFRPNIVVSSGVGPFSEDSWERIWVLPSDEGEEEKKAMLQLVARCQRCLLTAVDPVTAEKDPSVALKLLNRSRMRVKKVEGMKGGNGRAGPCFGMYAIPLPLDEGLYGGLNKGDKIRVRWRPYELDDEPDRQA